MSPVLSSARRSVPLLLALLAALLLTGCQHAPTVPESPRNHGLCAGDGDLDLSLHVVASDRRGRLLDVKYDAAHGRLVDGKSLDDDATSKRLDEVVAHLRSAQKRVGTPEQSLDVVVFIHGGLNSLDNALERASTYVPAMCEEGKYPLFIVWPSEGLQTYVDSIANHYQGDWGHPGFAWTVPFKLATDAAEVVARSLLNYAKQLNRWAGGSCYNERLREFSRGWYCGRDGATDPYTDPCEEKDPVQGFSCSGGNRDAARDYAISQARYAPALPLKALTVPLVDPLGERAWLSMEARTRFVFRHPCRTDSGAAEGDCKPGIAATLFDKLDNGRSLIDVSAKRRAEIAAESQGPGMRITLIGHSMGTMVAADIVRKFPRLPYDNVVFFGAAITVREFRNSVEALLRERVRDCGDRCPGALAPFHFYNVSLHPYAEASEENGWGSLPSGSLLEWIDFVFRAPPELSERTLGRWANVAAMRSTFDEQLLAEHMHFHRLGLCATDPRKHGDFICDKDELGDPSTGRKPAPHCATPQFWRKEAWTRSTCPSKERLEGSLSSTP